ncbi:hypothetical protein R4579_16730 [Acinetobacter baumannii]|uniref:hypothetical protein n=1 Tax=Acinetobacter baumannii TaxID=470 RepID=UPI0023403D03|nr:hypothetical protein [Acinetobacter baumannii]MDC5023921.1 hypothetical protein [Acinetobacter baumannii]MDC5303126.1 hypothetical protein [Acinetobacter baumannii]MDC5478028.1 hypothetical protein [Acinetobacter baumannii]MDV7473202.1 hypothetical protein [Acinetobacter baumannii]
MTIVIKEPVAVVEADLKHMIQLIGFASDMAEQLNVMCKTIEEKADKGSDIKSLAHVARCFAESWANTFDCDREDYENRYFSKA